MVTQQIIGAVVLLAHAALLLAVLAWAVRERMRVLHRRMYPGGRHRSGPRYARFHHQQQPAPEGEAGEIVWCPTCQRPQYAAVQDDGTHRCWTCRTHTTEEDIRA